MFIVGFFVAIAVARVAPDAIRIGIPLGIFGYSTDAAGYVIKVPQTPTKGSDRLLIGDRVRVDRLKPFDRKPGFVRNGFTRENFDRRLPIDRHGKPRILHLHAVPEGLPSRVATLVRILVFLTTVALGAILYLIKPSIATFGIFAYSLGGDYPTTYMDVIFDAPWREILPWFGDAIRGTSRAGLLLFALCLLFESPRAERRFAMVLVPIGVALGLLNAFDLWQQNYIGRPLGGLDQLYTNVSSAITVVTTLVFLASTVRAQGIQRQRRGWIVVSFAIAGAARLLSDRLYPTKIDFWENSVLLTLTVVPIFTLWAAVIKDHFFDVDFVVSRAIVYVAITASVLGIVTVSEEILSYVFYNNTDLATGIVVAISMLVGSLFGKIKSFLDGIVDRYVFRDRRRQRKALERITTRIIDAQTVEDVYNALYHDVTDALKLEFGGIMNRLPDGSYELGDRYNWPEGYTVHLSAENSFTRAVAKSRSFLTFTGKQVHLARKAFPDERLTFAAPIFLERTVTAIVVYGNNISGLALDPDERQLLVRLVAHASIALNAIELARYRAHVEALPAPAASPS